MRRGNGRRKAVGVGIRVRLGVGVIYTIKWGGILKRG